MIVTQTITQQGSSAGARRVILACIPYDIVAVALFLTLLKLDRFAARSFTPYLLYGVWQANAVVGP